MGNPWGGFEQEMEMMEIEVAALNDDVEFFRQGRYERAHLFLEGIYVAAALAGGARVAEWACRQQVENAMTRHRGQALQLYLDPCTRILWPTVWPIATRKLMEIPEVRKYAIYHAAAYGAKTLAALHSIKKITRAECMLWGGLILKKAGVAAKKYLIRTCGLSRSDFASMGVQFPNECI